ncbi:hypothetical protein [Nocardiopsis baichengensis]|uniref:hypothetical protein n=1 Tax=Nocardiopsis baichengensis TaxID=280240 RepID=UPI000345F4F1|nr:hypothetical protein [Nocardiopsis baichengensis]
MGDSQEQADHYRRVYTAAAQMMWLQHGTYIWRADPWTEERRAAWTALEEELARIGLTAVADLDGFNPAHHLISRRTSDGRPITLAQATDDWHRRVARDAGIATAPRNNGYDGIAPDGAVVLSASWLAQVHDAVFDEMDARLAPGRPSVTIGPQAQQLADLLHDLAARLRAPLSGQDPTPARTAALPASSTGPELGGTGSEADFERLDSRARAAAQSLPSRARLKADRDFSVAGPAVDAAQRLLAVLDGEDSPAWQEPTEEADPAHHLVKKGVSAATLNWEAQSLREVLDRLPSPRLPRPDEAPEDFETPAEPAGTTRLILMPPATALVTAEVLDEYAARVTPDQHIGPLLFDAYPLCAFLRRFDERLQRL